MNNIKHVVFIPNFLYVQRELNPTKPLNCEELNTKSNGTKWKTVPWFTSESCMVFCTPIISSLTSDNETIINSNITLADDEVGKVESIKFRDGTQCKIDDDNQNENSIPSNGMCIAGQCQVSFYQSNLI